MPRSFIGAKKDTSQPDIEKAFLAAGWCICDTHALGKNAPDLFAAKAGVTVAIECKTGNNKRKDHQVEWGERWAGNYLWGSDAVDLLLKAELLLSKEVPF